MYCYANATEMLRFVVNDEEATPISPFMYER